MNKRRRKMILRRVRALPQDNQVTAPPVPAERIARGLAVQLRFSPLYQALPGQLVRHAVPTRISVRPTTLTENVA